MHSIQDIRNDSKKKIKKGRSDIDNICILSKKYQELVNKTQTIYYSSICISSPSK